MKHKKEPWFVYEYEYLGYVINVIGRTYLHFGRDTDGSFLYIYEDLEKPPPYMYSFIKDTKLPGTFNKYASNEDMESAYHEALERYIDSIFDKVLKDL